MVGGGQDSFIGPIHRKAAHLDGEIELVYGAFSSNPKKSQNTRSKLSLDPNRVYGTFSEMVERESRLLEKDRIDFVSIIECLITYTIQ